VLKDSNLVAQKKQNNYQLISVKTLKESQRTELDHEKSRTGRDLNQNWRKKT